MGIDLKSHNSASTVTCRALHTCLSTHGYGGKVRSLRKLHEHCGPNLHLYQPLCNTLQITCAPAVMNSPLGSRLLHGKVELIRVALLSLAFQRLCRYG